MKKSEAQNLFNDFWMRQFPVEKRLVFAYVQCNLMNQKGYHIREKEELSFLSLKYLKNQKGYHIRETGELSFQTLKFDTSTKLISNIQLNVALKYSVSAKLDPNFALKFNKFLKVFLMLCKNLRKFIKNIHFYTKMKTTQIYIF